jgi:predicted RNA-binding Zn ribbon-like protein
MALPSWVQDEEDKPAPMPLLLVQAFVNTRDIDRDTDVFLDAAAATAWLGEAGIVGPGTVVAPRDLKVVRDVRESLRALVAGNGGGPAPGADEVEPLAALARSHHAWVTVEPTGHIGLAPRSDGRLADGLLGLLLVVRDAQLDGTWPRLKTCGNPDCRWAFYDRSHSRRGTWCDMASCGNLIKNRNLRARRR